jgi:hypothetical protein
VEIFQAREGGFTASVTQNFSCAVKLPVDPNDFTTLRCRREGGIRLNKAAIGGVGVGGVAAGSAAGVLHCCTDGGGSFLSERGDLILLEGRRGGSAHLEPVAESRYCKNC